MNINARTPLSFGKLIVETPSGRYTKDKLPKEAKLVEDQIANRLLIEHSDNEKVKYLDSRGIDVAYGLFIDPDRQSDGIRVMSDMKLKRNNGAIPFIRSEGKRSYNAGVDIVPLEERSFCFDVFAMANSIKIIRANKKSQ